VVVWVYFFLKYVKKYGTIPQADVYIMKNIIHDWNDNRAIDIFKAIQKAANEQ
ncbi:unnamed protein product, partial [Adineta steineri]